MVKEELKILFRNQFNCYADSEDVELAMTEERFVDVVSKIISQAKKEGRNERYCFRKERDRCSCSGGDNYDEFWKDIVENKDGSINLQAVKDELHDFTHVLEQIPQIYMTLTGGVLSKTGYWAKQITDLHNDAVEESYNSGYQDGLNKNKLSQK